MPRHGHIDHRPPRQKKIKGRGNYFLVGMSCPFKKALITLFRGEMSEGICLARTLTEKNDYIAFFEKRGKALHIGPHKASMACAEIALAIVAAIAAQSNNKRFLDKITR